MNEMFKNNIIPSEIPIVLPTAKVSQTNTNLKENKIKVLLIGSGGVGKTALLNRIAGLSHDDRYTPTTRTEERTVRNIVFYDFPGQYRCGRHRSVPGLTHCIRIYDTTESENMFLSTTQVWRDIAMEICGYPCSTKFLVVGNKIDKPSRFLAHGGLLVSAKTGQGVEDLVDKILFPGVLLH